MTSHSHKGHSSRMLLWIVAALVVALAAIGAWALTRVGEGTAGETPGGATLELTAPSAAAGKCAVPSAEFLRESNVAFDGTVTAIEGESVTLAVKRWYRGGETTEVRVIGPSEQLRQILSGVDFEVGERYLVTAADGQVTLCGFSGSWSEQMAALYEEAFAE